MKSIGRTAELQRISKQLDDFRNGRLRWLHRAVASPPQGGLADFLDDVADVGAAAGDLTVRVTIDDYHLVDNLLEPLNRALGQMLSGANIEIDGSLQTTSALLNRIQQSDGKRKAFLVADVSVALRQLRDQGQVSNLATLPFISRLRALANQIEDNDHPLAVVLGWDDAVRDWAEVKEVVQRYAPAETLFADYGLGRKAWPLFEQVFNASGVKLAEDLPGICGSGLPPGAFAAAARAADRPLDGTLVLDVLRRRVDDPTLRQMVSAIPDPILIKLCLKDATLPDDPGFGAAVEPQAEGGYVATRDLYSALGLVPPREIVSLADSVQQRLDDRDPDLAVEIGTTVANILADGDAPRSGTGWAITAAPFFAERHPLGKLEVRLLVALEGGLDADQKAEALAYATQAEQTVDGLTKLLLILHHGPRFEVQMRRELFAGLSSEGIDNPRPCDEEETKTQGRFMSVLCMLELSTDQVVAAIRSRRGGASDGGFREDMADKLTHYFRIVQRRMPLLTPDLVQAEPLGKLISAAGAPVELSSTAGTALLSLDIATKIEGRRYVWRWRSDKLLQTISDLGIADQKKMAGYYLFLTNDWPAIGLALSSAYTADLLRWKDSALSTVDPAPLLKIHVERRREALAAVLRDSSASVREKFEEQLLEALPSEQSADSYELTLDKLDDLAERIAAAAKAHKDETDRLRQQLEAEIQKIGTVDDLSPDRVRQVEELRSAEPNKRTIDKGRELSLMLAQERDRRQQRTTRLETVRRQIEAFPPDTRGIAEQLLNDPKASVEEIRGKVEELRVGAEPQSTASPPAKATQSKTYVNSPEDLTRLAELYRNKLVQILAVEIRS